MYIYYWIIGSAAIILLGFLGAYSSVSAEIEELKKSSFKLRELDSSKFKISIKYFTPSSNSFDVPQDLEQIELLLKTSHYQNSEVFDLESFEKMAANIGFHHIVFTPQLST